MILVVYVLSTWAGRLLFKHRSRSDITLTCNQPSAIDVEPGAPRSTIVNCNLTPRYQVKVEIYLYRLETWHTPDLLA